MYLFTCQSLRGGVSCQSVCGLWQFSLCVMLFLASSIVSIYGFVHLSVFARAMAA